MPEPRISQMETSGTHLPKKYRNNQVSSIDQDAETPDWLWSELSSRFQIDFDPCPREPGFDGKTTYWTDYAYVNPPFKESNEWLQVAIQQNADHNTNALFLLPFTKTHRLGFKVVYPHVTRVWLMNRMVCFKSYYKPLNKAMMLLEIGTCTKTNVSRPTGLRKLIFWDLPREQQQLGAVWAMLQKAVPSHVHLANIQHTPSKTIPPIFNEYENLVLLMPSRLDLLFIRRRLHRIHTIVVCPHLKSNAAENAPFMWSGTIVLIVTKDDQITKTILNQLPYLAQTEVPVEILQF